MRSGTVRRGDSLSSEWGKMVLAARALAVRYGVVVLMALSLGLIVLGKADVKIYDTIVRRAGDIAAPALATLKEPLSTLRDMANAMGSILALREENQRLREDNRRLLVWQAEATRLAVENDALRRSLKMPPHPGAPLWLTARVVADPGGPFVNTALIDAGADAGVQNGMAVVDDHGLVGRIVDVGARSARILMLTDLNSRIPVLIDRSHDEAVLEGTNGRQPELRFLPMNPSFKVGDQVLTSGRDGVLPQGLRIGKISEIRDQHVVVTPYVDWDRLDYVAVLVRQPLPTPEELPLPASDAAVSAPAAGVAKPVERAPTRGQSGPAARTGGRAE
ncbi:rod shape-determining protein MreC [Arboricoccus pini]|uniref:Cell shape-determining protein MreC n=1 Tax=Arboricoccus pini TaxID=1963835 RepID=A0A212QPS5_9PROT|nr:rod shape-determining protein MreC [Arboricoccus pini]SNB61417.1 rod shape-determining protein MreC [Arboricoccus pini]